MQQLDVLVTYICTLTNKYVYRCLPSKAVGVSASESSGKMLQADLFE